MKTRYTVKCSLNVITKRNAIKAMKGSIDVETADSLETLRDIYGTNQFKDNLKRRFEEDNGITILSIIILSITEAKK